MISTFRINNNNNSKSNYGLSCERCRVDKKKCDRKEPVCSRCIKLQAECRIYSRNAKGIKGLKLPIQVIQANSHSESSNSLNRSILLKSDI